MSSSPESLFDNDNEDSNTVSEGAQIAGAMNSARLKAGDFCSSKTSSMRSNPNQRFDLETI
jgi:hypothetical protein